MKNDTIEIDVKLFYKIIKTMKEYLTEMRIGKQNLVKIHDIKMRYSCYDDLLSGATDMHAYLIKTLDKYERLLQSEQLNNGIIAVEEKENDINTN